MLPEYSVDKEVTFCLFLIPRIMDEYEQDLRVLEEKHQQGLEKINIVIVTLHFKPMNIKTIFAVMNTS